MKTNTVLLVLTLFLCSTLLAQNAGINDDGTTADPSAMLHVESNTKGFILPRMTSTERAAISNPATGLLVFDTSKRSLYMFDGVNWLPLATVSDQYSAITPVTNADNYSFGSSIAVDGDKAVIGAFNHNSNKGAAYVYEKVAGEWQQIHTLTASDGVASDYFGSSVATNGNYITVGAPGANKAYLYEWATGFPERKILSSSDGVSGDNFGRAIAMDTYYGTNTYELILVGAPDADVSGNTDQGAVYLYSYDPGTTSAMELKITEASLNGNDYYGASVDIAYNKFVVGAWKADAGANYQQGKAFVYTFISPTTASLTTTLTSSDGNSEDSFGWSVSIGSSSYTRVAVGAPWHRVANKIDQGAVYVYEENGGWVESKITDPAGKSDDRFGYSVALDEQANKLLVGMPYSNAARGKILSFYRVTNLVNPYWEFNYEYNYPGASTGDRFGEKVAFDSDNQLITSADFIGKVYFRAY